MTVSGSQAGNMHFPQSTAKTNGDAYTLQFVYKSHNADRVKTATPVSSPIHFSTLTHILFEQHTHYLGAEFVDHYGSDYILPGRRIPFSAYIVL